MSREKWDEAFASCNEDDDAMESVPLASPGQKASGGMLPDWTRTPLPVGAPSVAAPKPTVAPSTLPMAVGA